MEEMLIAENKAVSIFILSHIWRIDTILMLHKNKSPITETSNKTLFVIDKLQMSWRYANIRNFFDKTISSCYLP